MDLTQPGCGGMEEDPEMEMDDEMQGRIFHKLWEPVIVPVVDKFNEVLKGKNLELTSPQGAGMKFSAT